MSITSGFFDSTTTTTVNGFAQGNNAKDAVFFAKYFSSFIGTGVYPSPSSNFQVSAGAGLNISIGAGMCFIRGYFGYTDTTESLILTANNTDTTYRIILRLSTQTAAITLASINSGVSLNRTAPIYELAIADVNIRANATSVSNTDITDLRYDADLCGMVTGVVQQMDGSTFAQQLDAIVAEAVAAKAAFDIDTVAWEAEWDAWFTEMRDQLDSDAAGHLEETKAEKTLSNVADGTVATRLITDGAVTAAKLDAAVRAAAERVGGFDYGTKFI